MILKLHNNGKSVVGTREDGATVSYSIDAEEYKQWLSKGNTPEPEFTDAELLYNAKTAKLQELETVYETAITANITYNTVVYQADLGSQSLMAQNLSVGSVPTGFYWRALDNTKVSMTFVQLQGLASAIQARGMLAFDNKVNRKDAVNVATTITAVNAVTY